MRTFNKSLIAATIAFITNSYADQHSLVGQTYDFSKSINHAVKLQDGKVVQDFKVDQNTSILTVAEVLGQKLETSTYVDEGTISQGYTGQAAIDYLGKEGLKKTAAKVGFDPDYLAEQLKIDNTLIVRKDGSITVVEPVNKKELNKAKAAQMAAASTVQASSVVAANGQPANVFTLHSNPGASKRIFLQFKGYNTAYDGWGTGNGLPYDTDGDTTTFSASEQDDIYYIWNSVKEDYAPFDVDITTEEPTQAQIVRDSADDNEYGTYVLITSSAPSDFSSIGNRYIGGIAYIGTFDSMNFDAQTTPSTYSFAKSRVALVFAKTGLGNWSYAIAECASHESGHTLGLFHHGIKSNGVNYAYYYGHGNGETGWAPIMGSSYYKNITQWSNGSYGNATNPNQSDLTVIGGKLSPTVDIVSDTTASAITLTDFGNGSFNSYNSIINSSTDVDMFNFYMPGNGTVNITGVGNMSSDISTHGNLDIKMTLLDNLGNAIVVSDDQNTVDASISTTLDSGLYYVKIESGYRNAVLDPTTGAQTDGYPVYASQGNYQLSVNYTLTPVSTPSPIPTAIPTVPPTAIPTQPPIVQPTTVPTVPPTVIPTVTPIPTVVPTAVPTSTPTPNPTQPPVPPTVVITTTGTNGEAPLKVDFSAADSLIGSGGVDVYRWDFGDNAADSIVIGTDQVSPSHTYNKTGVFLATAYITNTYGLTSSNSIYVAVMASDKPSVHIKSIALSTKALKKPLTQLVAKVSMVNQLKRAAVGSTIYGYFSGTYREYKGGPEHDIAEAFPYNANLGYSGGRNSTVTITTPTGINMKGGATISFTVTRIDPPFKLYYNAVQNAMNSKTLVKK